MIKTNNIINSDNLIKYSPDSVSVKIEDDLESVIRFFIADQQVMDSTRRTYSWAIRRFFRWCRETGRETGSLQRADIISYVDELTKKGYKPKSIAYYTVSVRRFFGWLNSRGKYPNIASGVKGPRKMKQEFVKMHLSADERRELLREAEKRGERDYAIVNLMLRNGLRTIEVSRLDVGDISVRRGVRVMKVWRKGSISKDSMVVLTDGAYGPIRAYLDTRGPTLDGSPLFVTAGDGQTGTRMSPRRIQQIVRCCLDAIGLTGREYSPHSLRHTTAVAILEGGGDIFDVQTVLGHSSPEVSQIYTKSVEEERRLTNPPENMVKV